MTEQESEELSEAERGRLLGAAVQGVAWALIEGDTDTSDRGVGEEHYRKRVADARRILPGLIPVAARDAKQAAKALRDAALSGLFGTNAQSTLLAEADRIEGEA